MEARLKGAGLGGDEWGGQGRHWSSHSQGILPIESVNVFLTSPLQVMLGEKGGAGGARGGL